MQLAGGPLSGEGELLGGGEGLAGQGGAAEQSPASLLEVQPTPANWDEHLADAGWAASQVRVEKLEWLHGCR